MPVWVRFDSQPSQQQAQPGPPKMRTPANSKRYDSDDDLPPMQSTKCLPGGKKKVEEEKIKPVSRGAGAGSTKPCKLKNNFRNPARKSKKLGKVGTCLTSLRPCSPTFVWS